MTIVVVIRNAMFEIIASVLANTPIAPFIPQSHAVGLSSGYSCLASLMPVGKALPMRNPAGTTKSKQTVTRTHKTEAENSLNNEFDK